MKKIIILSLLLASITTLSSNVLAQDLNTAVKALTDRVEKLEKKVESIGSKEQKEAAARNDFIGIQNLVSSGEYAKAKTAVKSFKTKYAGTKYISAISRVDQELAVVGKAAPKEWKIEKWFQNKDDIDLNSKKPTMVVFWELWCPHCKREVPKIVELKSKFAEKGVQFIGLTKLSRSTKEADLLKFLEANKVNYPIAKENGDLSDYFAVSGVPAGVFLKDGKVIWRGHPAVATAEKIESWIK